MKKIIQFIGIPTLICVICINIWIFAKGVALSDEIHQYESHIQSLQKENSQLEVAVFASDSIAQTASLAAELNFTTEGSPLHPDILQYALKDR